MSARLLLPKQHSSRQVPNKTFDGMIRRGQAKDRTHQAPVFLEFTHVAVRGHCISHYAASEAFTDTMDLDFTFRGLRVYAYADAMKALSNFKSNYFGNTSLVISRKDYDACGGTNLRSRLASSTWTIDPDGKLRRKTENQYELSATIAVDDAEILLPRIMYPELDEEGNPPEMHW